MTVKRLSLPLTALMLSGCIVYPVHKTLQPKARVTVSSTSGARIAGATVTLISHAYPYSREKSRMSVVTQNDGVARFPRIKEWRTESLMIHGAEVFYWNWCVQRDGYETVATQLRGGDDLDRSAAFTLSPGVSTPCPEVR